MNTELIREQNDLFRLLGRLGCVPGKFMVTRGVDELTPDDRQKLYEKIQIFDDFDDGNDPHREHDFGAVKFKGKTYYWKIDYYDTEYRMESTDPSDISKTRRVMTIMRDDEY